MKLQLVNADVAWTAPDNSLKAAKRASVLAHDGIEHINGDNGRLFGTISNFGRWMGKLGSSKWAVHHRCRGSNPLCCTASPDRLLFQREDLPVIPVVPLAQMVLPRHSESRAAP